MYLTHISPCFETHRSEQPRRTTRRQISRQFPLCRIQSSITDLSISGSLTTSFRGIVKRCCAILVVFRHPSKGGFEFLLKVLFSRLHLFFYHNDLDKLLRLQNEIIFKIMWMTEKNRARVS